MEIYLQATMSPTRYRIEMITMSNVRKIVSLPMPGSPLPYSLTYMFISFTVVKVI